MAARAGVIPPAGPAPALPRPEEPATDRPCQCGGTHPRMSDGISDPVCSRWPDCACTEGPTCAASAPPPRPEDDDTEDECPVCHSDLRAAPPRPEESALRPDALVVANNALRRATQCHPNDPDVRAAREAVAEITEARRALSAPPQGEERLQAAASMALAAMQRNIAWATRKDEPALALAIEALIAAGIRNRPGEAALRAALREDEQGTR
jgi:hypothetical protein